MRHPKRRNPAGQWRGFGNAKSKGQERRQQYNPNAAPASFWKGWNGPEEMAPAIIRRQPTPADSLWRPKQAGGET